MKELKMYEAPKMEVVKIEVEAVLAVSGTNAPGTGWNPGDSWGGGGNNDSDDDIYDEV